MGWEIKGAIVLSAEDVIRLLDLKPLPREGGFFRETYRSADVLPAAALGGRYSSAKAASTAIYYFLTPDCFSALHRLPTDEIYHFYAGDPVELLWLGADGVGKVVTLGNDLKCQQPQLVVPRGTWQGSRLKPGGAWALMGTTVAPAFDFSDFEAADAASLMNQYPHYADWIRRLTPS